MIIAKSITGDIGKAIRAKSFGMNITVWSVPFSPEEAEDLQVRYAASPLEAARGADVLSIHLPLVDQTRGLIDSTILSSLHDDAYLINTSRGELINENDLLNSIKEKNLRVGLDVFCNEPGANDKEVSSPLCQEENVYVTHHIGASTNQSTESIGSAVISIIKD